MNVFCCGLSMLFNSLAFQDPSVMTLKPVIRGQLQSMKGTAYWHMLIVCINSCRKNSCASCEGSGRTCPHHSWVRAVMISSAHQKSMQTRSKGCGTRCPSSWTCFVVDSACYSTAWPSKTLQWWHWSQLSEDNCKVWKVRHTGTCSKMLCLSASQTNDLSSERPITVSHLPEWDRDFPQILTQTLKKVWAITNHTLKFRWFRFWHFTLFR